MNQEWSEKNRSMQALLKKNTFSEGIGELLALRELLMQEVRSWRRLPEEAFHAIPYLHADGYHSKTAAYSLWHIFRIEDIVVNSLILQREEILFSGNFMARTHSPIITTGNELKGMEIAEFSEALDLDALYEYIEQVRKATDAWLLTLEPAMLKKTFTDADRERLQSLNVVSADEEAVWLIDYWCGKDLKGLLKMPLSRHWIMHIEAALRILRKVC